MEENKMQEIADVLMIGIIAVVAIVGMIIISKD